MTEAAQEPQSASVSHMPKVTDKDVDEAAQALKANSTRAFSDGDVLDGTKDFDKQGVEEENETKAPPVQKIASDNLPEVPEPDEEINKFIMEKKEAMDEIAAKRAKLNEEANLVRAELKEKGIDTKTFEYACRLMDMDEDKRDRIDRSLILVRAAGHKPVQVDIFAAKH
jgi:hypothetical protein